MSKVVLIFLLTLPLLCSLPSVFFNKPLINPSLSFLSSSSKKVSLNQILLSKRQWLQKYPNYLSQLHTNSSSEHELNPLLRFSTIWAVKSADSICLFHIRPSQTTSEEYDLFDLIPGIEGNVNLQVEPVINIPCIENHFSQPDPESVLPSDESLDAELHKKRQTSPQATRLSCALGDELELLRFSPSLFMTSTGVLADQRYLRRVMLRHAQEQLSLFSSVHLSPRLTRGVVGEDNSECSVLNLRHLASYCSSRLHTASLFSETLPLSLSCLFLGQEPGGDGQLDPCLIEVDSLGNLSEPQWSVIGGILQEQLVQEMKTWYAEFSSPGLNPPSSPCSLAEKMLEKLRPLYRAYNTHDRLVLRGYLYRNGQLLRIHRSLAA